VCYSHDFIRPSKGVLPRVSNSHYSTAAGRCSILARPGFWIWIFRSKFDTKDSINQDNSREQQGLGDRSNLREKRPSSYAQRQSDQVIVFLNNAQYEVVYPDGKREMRVRKAGEAIWHSRGETAPNLTNTGSRYQTLVINLK
jgi:hypothetical protein